MPNNERPPAGRRAAPEQESELSLDDERNLATKIRSFHQAQYESLVSDLLDPSRPPVTPQEAALIAAASNTRWVHFVASILDLDPELSKQILKITRR